VTASSHAKPKAVCVLSGGMDSTTLLYMLIANGYETYAISFDYGQRHRKELEYAARTCAKLGVEHKVVDISAIQEVIGTSALTSEAIEVPDGHYEDESMKITVVPNRNMIMFAIAAGWAVAIEAERIGVAVHAGDHAIYPDCREEFIVPFAEAVKRGNYHQVETYAPFLHASKTEIARIGLGLGIDYEADTWSCYKGGAEPCGTCGTCVERAEALAAARSKE
jgi:7-cyano-7-deazaguanine synthase